ncbi:hypothetical protein [Aurantibacter sp.]|uniref:hypothetical protein n=1 Tax=Aurantibacter sp. TaxID=2807103 RepID=UPI003264A6CE
MPKARFFFRNKAFLESILDRLDNWDTHETSPIYIGEVDTGAPSFENNKGGMNFV